MGQRVEPGSFRDPGTKVFYEDGRVLRGLDERAAADWTALSATGFFAAFQADGRIVGTRALESSDPVVAAADFASVLEHESIPFISYPYEWSFEMLRAAAVLHLEVLQAALDENITMKDGYAFNVQWRGPTPAFIDIGSFEQSANGPWSGYRQFCGTFLYPLLIEAHLGISFQRLLIGHLDGFDPTEVSRLFAGRRRYKKGVFRNVFLHSVAETRVTRATETVRDDLGKSGFNAELTKATVRKLLKLVRGLTSKRSESAWKAYRETCSYSDEDRAAKEAILREALVGRHPQLVLDLGANDGVYARVAAEHSDYVVAVDSDDVTVDAMFRSLREDGITNVLPLVVNLVDPSPARGWRGLERRAFTDRGRPDLVLALALVHHLAIASNIPIPEIIAWLRSIGGTLVIEFVEPSDPMARLLLANKREGLFPDYRIDAFEASLSEHYSIVTRAPLPGGTRTLYVAEPR